MRRRAASLLEIVAAVLIGATMAAIFAGPLRFEVLGATVSLRTLSRPLVAAALALALRAWLLRGPTFAHHALSVLTRVFLSAIIVAGVCGWLVFRSATCGGLDSYGYVSAADRLLSGQVIREEPLAALLPFPDGIAAACPLGYVPAARTPNASVPMYPLGLPALMAGATIVLGPNGPFWVAPLMGLVLLAASYAAARAWYPDTEAALVACALLAVQPLVFTYSIQPMSDVPAAAAVMLAVAASSQPGLAWRTFAAGVAGAVALLVRPALAPAVILLAAVPVLLNPRQRWRSALAYLLPLALAIVLQGWEQKVLYGSVFSSGYGNISGLFSIETVATNLRSYTYWSWRALGPVWIGALAIGLGVSGRVPRAVVVLLAIGVGVPYVFFFPYDHWETLRFLLPLLVPATIVAAAGLLAISRALVGPHGATLAAVITVATVSTWLSWLAANQVFSMPEHETRHRLAGELVVQATPPNAVVLSLQHSGSLRYYAHRQTINWDRIPTGMFDATVESLRRHGLPVYLMIDSEAERAMFRARHGDVVDNAGWLPSGQRRNVQLFEAPGRPPDSPPEARSR